jgi:hypothetical protein
MLDVGSSIFVVQMVKVLTRRAADFARLAFDFSAFEQCVHVMSGGCLTFVFWPCAVVAAPFPPRLVRLQRTRQTIAPIFRMGHHPAFGAVKLICNISPELGRATSFPNDAMAVVAPLLVRKVRHLFATAAKRIAEA